MQPRFGRNARQRSTRWGVNCMQSPLRQRVEEMRRCRRFSDKLSHSEAHLSSRVNSIVHARRIGKLASPLDASPAHASDDFSGNKS